MTDLDALVAELLEARGDSQPMLAVKDVLARIVSDPAGVEARVDAPPGVSVVHQSDELTVLSVVVPAGTPQSLPHNHEMWAVVGIYGGREENAFFVRADQGLEERGGRSLQPGDTLAMGDDTIHAIKNPSTRDDLAAIHVYGGDLLAASRKMWTRPDFVEAPYDDTKVLGRPMRR